MGKRYLLFNNTCVRGAHFIRVVKQIHLKLFFDTNTQQNAESYLWQQDVSLRFLYIFVYIFKRSAVIRCKKLAVENYLSAICYGYSFSDTVTVKPADGNSSAVLHIY